MAFPSQAKFHQFGNLSPELRQIIWQKAMPAYSTVPVASIIKNSDLDTEDVAEPVNKPTDVIWAIEALPRSRWPLEFRYRVQAMQNLYNVNFEARQEVIKRFPAVHGSESGQIRFSPTNDLVLLTRSPQLEMVFFHGRVSMTYLKEWNYNITKLAIEHSVLALFLAHAFEAPHGLIFNIARRAVRAFAHFLHQLPNLKHLSLVNPRALLLTAWRNTSAEHQSLFLQELRTSYSSGLQMIFSTDVPTKETLLYANMGFQANDISLLTRAVDRLKRVVGGDTQAGEGQDLTHGIDFGQQRLQHLEIRKMYHISTELQSLCLT